MPFAQSWCAGNPARFKLVQVPRPADTKLHPSSYTLFDSLQEELSVRSAFLLLLSIPVVALSGCATQPAPDIEAGALHRQLEARLARLESEQGLVVSRLGQDDATLKHDLDALRARVSDMQQTLARIASQTDGQAGAIQQAQSTADDAIRIARDSRLVSGKVVHSLQLNEDMVLFNYEAPELTAAGRAALDQLIAATRPQLPHVFIEVIGFSDNISLGSQNSRIALERAESVRRYLHETGHIPLHRMSAISYGDLKPVTHDPAFESRRQNRRVIVQVLK